MSLTKTRKKEKANDGFTWDKTLTRILLTNYRQYDCLYDTKSHFYSNKHARTDALLQICEKIKENEPRVTMEDVKSKINNMRSQLSHELQKIKDSKKSGIGTDDIYEPTVWWFDEMQFLVSYMKARKGKDSLTDSLQDDKEALIDTQGEMQHYDSDNNCTQDMNGNTSEEEASVDIPSTSKINENRQPNLTPGHPASLTSRPPLSLRETPASKRAKFQKSIDAQDKAIEKTMETLSSLSGKIMASQSQKPTVQYSESEFGLFVAKEISDIDDPDILLDVKHEINNVIYKYKKTWIRQKEGQIKFVIEDSDSE